MTQLTIADRLRDLRTLKSVNQDIAAEACGISRIALARYETGQRSPRIEIATRLADYYGVSVDYLLGGDEPSPAPHDTRAEAKRLLEGLSDEQYNAALQYIQFLKSQK